MKRAEEPKIYKRQVLPFSPHRVIHALHRYVQDISESNSSLVDYDEKSFYVDKCFRSSHSKEVAKDLVDDLS